MGRKTYGEGIFKGFIINIIDEGEVVENLWYSRRTTAPYFAVKRIATMHFEMVAATRFACVPDSSLLPWLVPLVAASNVLLLRGSSYVLKCFLRLVINNVLRF